MWVCLKSINDVNFYQRDPKEEKLISVTKLGKDCG